MSDEWSSEELYVFNAVHEARAYGEMISPDIAMTIASWWHSPGSPNSTLLSTMGKVACDADMGDFATPAEYRSADNWNRWALDCLTVFIRNRQKNGMVTHLPGCAHEENEED